MFWEGPKNTPGQGETAQLTGIDLREKWGKRREGVGERRFRRDHEHEACKETIHDLRYIRGRLLFAAHKCTDHPKGLSLRL